MKDGRNDTPVCFKCGADLEWSEEYRRWECPMFAKHPENATIAPPEGKMSETPLALDPCPHCGGPLVIQCNEPAAWWWLCGPCGIESTLFPTREKATANANRRALASPPPQAPEIEEGAIRALLADLYHAAKRGEPITAAKYTEAIVNRHMAKIQSATAAPPQEPAAPAYAPILNQQMAEIRDTMADKMLNDGQKVTFIASILAGHLANPPKLGGYNG